MASNNEPPFDDDELINDYNEDYFDPTNEYDDDAMEEMMRDDAGKPSNANIAENKSSTTTAVLDSGQFGIAYGDNGDNGVLPTRSVTHHSVIEGRSASLVGGDGIGIIPPEVTVDRIKRRDKQLHSFERCDFITNFCFDFLIFTSSLNFSRK